MKTIILSISTFLLLSFAMHKYYVSITEIAYNDENNSFEMSLKFIGHDLEKALANAGAPNLFLGTEKEHEKANFYLAQYINQRLQIIADDKVLPLNFEGKEVNNDDFIYCYLVSEKVKSPLEVTIKNTLLTEVFSGQANTVYLTVGNQKKTSHLNKSRVSETHELTQ